jgi:hypothetical protein
MWLWASLAVVASAVLLMRLILPHHIEAPASRSIPDLSVTNPLNQPGGGTVSADAYDVYSALYQKPQQEPLAFAKDSVTDIPQLNGSCLKPSTPSEREMVDAFVAANHLSHQWEKKFAIPFEYRLLNGTETVMAENCLETHGRSGANCGTFQGLRHVRFLGVPGFDRAHMRALVSVVKLCGKYCGSGGIFAVEKTGDTWRRSEPTDFTRDCSWMY